jgi:hypothetical protein
LFGISFASSSLGGKHETTIIFYIVLSVLRSAFLAHSENEQNAEEVSTSFIIRIRTIKLLFGFESNAKGSILKSA